MVAGTGLATLVGLIRRLADPSGSCLITVLPRGDLAQAGADHVTHFVLKEGSTVHTMLAGAVGFAIGVDTHGDTHTAAIVDATSGGVVDRISVPTDAFGHRRLKAFADQHAPSTRVWATEGTGSYGAGLTTSLLEHGEWVVEIDRPARPARRDGANSDDLDAVRAAREALSRERLAAPRARGGREALRVLMAARQGAVVARTKAIGGPRPSSSTHRSRCVTSSAGA